MNDALSGLARVLGVQTEYFDYRGERRVASAEALVEVARALGAELDGPTSASRALAAARRAQWQRLVEPCVVVWDDAPLVVELRVPAGARRFRATAALGAVERAREGALDELPELERVELEGASFVRRRLELAGGLGSGYGTLLVEVDGIDGRSVVIAAPSRCWAPAEQRKTWGVFAPLYALRSARSQGGGGPDLTDLARLAGWVGARGGTVVATLPLLAGYFDQPSDGSPYSPISALFYNELYLDLNELPELRGCAEAQRLLADGSRTGAALAGADPVNYVGWYAHRRPVLAALAEAAFAPSAPRREALERFIAEPRVADYARFRAEAQARGRDWRAWPMPMRGGALDAAAFDVHTYRYHLFAQFALREQLRAASATARARGGGLYLDLPVGVNPDGYDAWREQGLFAQGITVGAPPDELFGGGQDWGVPAIAPQQSRATGHAYFAETLRAHLEHAGTLRIDHVMGLYRRFVVPRGRGATEGVYLRYPEDELFAILCLESHASKSIVVGEDLGTVPDAVRERMSRHGLRRIFVGQFSFNCDGDQTFVPAPVGCAASFNTHDMPSFAGFWRGQDIDDRRDLGLIDEPQAAEEHAGRERLRDVLGGDERVALERCLRALSDSDAWLVLVSLEDLWHETRQQNTPGTTDERANWRHRMRHTLDELDGLDDANRLLATIAKHRARAW